MSHPLLVLVLGALAVIAAGAPAWAHYAPVSFWLGLGFPVKAIRVRLTWTHVAESCGLAQQRRRWRWTLDAVPVAGTLKRTSVLLTPGRRMRRVTVIRAPGLGMLRPNRMGWAMRIRLREGQVPDDYSRAAEQLAHAWRVHAVRVTATAPGLVWLIATRTDPLTDITITPQSADLLTVRVGMLETGQPWMIDFRVVPHWLNAGATQSGKSNLANAIIAGLAPQPVALVGFDLKGVEFTPYAARLSALATTRGETCRLLEDLAQLVADRMDLCRQCGARDIWRLPDPLRPVPVVILVDEVAELYLIADKTEKEQVTRISTGLLRLAQLGRAFGVYLVICGQRIGSDLGPGVTALRAQLSGRICHRVNDPETATMTLGDLDPAALDAARVIPAQTPGVAVIASTDGTWHRARSAHVTDHHAEQAAASSHLTPDWAVLTARPPPRPPRPRPGPGGMSRPVTRAERQARRLLDLAPVLILAAIAGAGSFTHIRDTASQHGQHGPMSWAIAICIDLTCVMAARERQHDKAHRLTWPTIVLTGGVLLSLAANLDQAQPDAWGRITAATPAAAFLVAVSMLERRATRKPLQQQPPPPRTNPAIPS